MESRTIAVVDSIFWFTKVGIVLSLLTGTIAHRATNTYAERIGDAAMAIEVKLVKTLPSRNPGRRALGVGDRAIAVSTAATPYTH